MDRFLANNFASICLTLGQFSQESKAKARERLTELDRSNLIEQLAGWREDCERTGLAISAMAIDDLAGAVPHVTLHSELSPLFDEIGRTITRELSAPRFFHISSEKMQYTVTNVFAAIVTKNFRTAEFDIREAGRCLALARNTASVFHLMRVVEIGLRAVAKELQASVEGLDSWEDILRRIRDALPKRDFAERALPPKAYFENLIGYLYAIKIAWRNPTMHVGVKYTEEEARGIFNAVRVFLHRAAEHLNDQ